MIPSNLVLIPGAGGVGRAVFEQFVLRMCRCVSWPVARTSVRLS